MFIGSIPLEVVFFGGVFFLVFSCGVAIFTGVFSLVGVLGFCRVVLAFFLH